MFFSAIHDFRVAQQVIVQRLIVHAQRPRDFNSEGHSHLAGYLFTPIRSVQGCCCLAFHGIQIGFNIRSVSGQSSIPVAEVVRLLSKGNLSLQRRVLQHPQVSE